MKANTRIKIKAIEKVAPNNVDGRNDLNVVITEGGAELILTDDEVRHVQETGRLMTATSLIFS